MTGVDVSFQVVHSYESDLVIDLNADSTGSLGNYNLWNREGGGGDNPSKTVNNISTFNGLTANRTWYLYAKDFVAGDNGYIDSWSITVHYTAPALAGPTINSPGTSSDTSYTISNLTPQMSWNSVSGADHYGLYISKAPYGSGNIIYSKANVTGTSFTLPSGTLQNGVKYKWNMTAFNSDGVEGSVGNSLYFQAPTPVTVLAGPTITSPGTASDTGSTTATKTPTINWGAVSGATKYGLYISQSPYGAGNIIYQNQSLTGTSFTLPSGTLQDGVKYKWNMTTFNSAGEGSVGNSLYFQTPAATTIDLQGLDLYAPSSAQWGQTITVSPVDIKNYGTGAAGAFQVQWYLSRDALGSADDILLSQNGGATSYNVSGLAAGDNTGNFSVSLQLPASLPSGWTGTSFYVVMKTDSANQVAESNENNNFGQVGGTYDWDDISISTPVAPLGPPTLSAPGGTSAPGTTLSTFVPQFQWQQVTGADGYGLYVSKLQPDGVTYSTIFNSETNVGSPLPGTSYTLPTGYITGGGQYRWNMTTHNAAGYGGANLSRFYFTVATAAAYAITPNPASVNENAGSLTFTVTRSGSFPAETVYASTVQGAANGYATNSNDYATNVNNLAVSFAAGDTSKTVSVTILDDSTAESNETFGFIVQRNTSDPVTTSLAKSIFTIADNDNPSGGSVSELNQLVENPGFAITGRANGGVAASESIARSELDLADRFKELFVEVGLELNIPPALLAGIASRESKFGELLDSNGRGDGGRAYGMFQLDVGSVPNPDTADGPLGLAHIREAATWFVEQKLAAVIRSHPAADTRSKQLFVATSFYNGGYGHTFPNSDEGTTGGDYANDVFARARVFAQELSWSDSITYSITPSPASVSENAGSLTFTITRSGSFPAETVYASTVQGAANGYATNSNDYATNVNNLAVSFAAGDTSKTVSVSITDDSNAESDETFGFIVQRNSNDPVTTYLAKTSFTIVDDDAPTSFASVSGGTLSVDQSAAGGPVTLSESGDSVSVSAPAGTYAFLSAAINTISIAGTNADDIVNINSALDKPVTFDGGVGNDTLAVNAGTVTFDQDLQQTNSHLSIIVATGAFVTFAATQHLAALTLTGGTAQVTPGGGKSLVLGSLSITDGGRLDLADNNLVVDYTGPSPAAAIRGYLQAGRNGGAWDGPGIFSSVAATNANHAIAYAEASAIGSAGFPGPVDNTAILLKYASTGDANLDGTLNADDYILSDRGKAKGLGNWLSGDFDYDGIVTVADLALLDRSFAAAHAPAPAVVVVPETAANTVVSPTAVAHDEVAASVPPAAATPVPAAPETVVVPPASVAPFSFAGASGVKRGKAAKFTLHVLTPPAKASSKPIRYAIDWNGDRRVDQIVRGRVDIRVKHKFKKAGLFNVTVAILDAKGHVAGALQSTDVQVAN